jgi:hypothetical protein
VRRPRVETARSSVFNPWDWFGERRSSAFGFGIMPRLRNGDEMGAGPRIPLLALLSGYARDQESPAILPKGDSCDSAAPVPQGFRSNSCSFVVAVP